MEASGGDCFGIDDANTNTKATSLSRTPDPELDNAEKSVPAAVTSPTALEVPKEAPASLKGSELHGNARSKEFGDGSQTDPPKEKATPPISSVETVAPRESSRRPSAATVTDGPRHEKNFIPCDFLDTQTTYLKPKSGISMLKRLLQKLRGCIRYEPFNEYENKVRIGEYKSGRFALSFDRLGGSNKHPPCSDLPRTPLGAVLTIGFVALILTLVIRSIVTAASNETETINLDYVAINLDCINEDLNSVDLASCRYEVEAEEGGLGQPWYWISQMIGEAAIPSLDVPVMEVRLTSIVQFFEKTRETSLDKVIITDLLGLSESLVSSNEATPPTLSAVDSVQAPLGSFHESSAVLTSSVLSKTVKTFNDMQGAAASHLFDDTMMYWYLKRNVFQSLADFFEHKVALYTRFDRDQLRQLKSCQLQVGLVNEAMFNLVKDDIKEDRRIFSTFPFLKSNPFCWQPDNWNPITHRFSPGTDASVTANLVTLQETMRLDELLEFIFATGWTLPQAPSSADINLRLRTKLAGECDAYEDFQASCSACSHLPCRNGGNCTDLPGFKYRCSCAEGFFGEDCSETDVFGTQRRLDVTEDFTCNSTQAESEYPDGKFWCQCRNGSEVLIRSNLISVIQSWGIFFNYVTNFNNSYSEITCADATMTVKTTSSQNAFATSLRTAAAPNASQDELYIQQKDWGSGFARAPPFYLMLSGLAGIERVLISEIQVPSSNSTDPFVLQAFRGLDSGFRLKFDLEDPGDPPATPSSKWICHARLYNDGRQCDCRCGMPDPDCLYPNLPVTNCGRGEVCSRMGRCTTPEASAGLSDATQVYVSEPCTQLFLPGSTDLAGFMGTEEEYRNVSGGGCPTCPYEPGDLYGGAASLSENCDDNGQCFQEFMCRYKAEGFIDARLVKHFDEYLEGAGEVFDSARRGFYTLEGGATNASNAYRLVVVKLGSRSPFPYGNDVGAYKLDINQDCGGTACGNKEIIEVVRAGAPDRSNRQVLMVRALAPSGFQKQHFSIGSIISALSESSTDVIVELSKEKYHFPISGPFQGQLDAIGIQFQQSSATQTKKIQRLLLETPLELTAGVRTSIVQDVPQGMNPDASLHPKAAFDDAVTIASHPWYGATVVSNQLDMYSWEWPTVDLYGLGAIQSTSSLAFAFNTSEFVDEDRGNGCSEAYMENTSTMKWVKVDDAWQGLFGSEVLPAMLCDGIHDGHALATDQGITEALASATAQNKSLILLIRDITGTQVTNFEIREVVNAWKYRAPVWWPDDPENCWLTNDSMVATDYCSCKDDCRCMPGCSEADCSTDNVSQRSFTCAYSGVAANMTERIQVKGSLRWLPEDWSCGGDALATSSYFADGTCDCGCARYDPDCAGLSGNPKAFAEEIDGGNGTVRNYCANEAALLGTDGWNTTVTSAGCQGFFFIQLHASSTAPTRWSPTVCRREEDVSLMLQFDATCAFDDASGFKADGSIILRVQDVSLGENCANYTDDDARCAWGSVSEAKYHCSRLELCKAVYCDANACFAATSTNMSFWTEPPPSVDDNSSTASAWFKSDPACHSAPAWVLAQNSSQTCTEACEARGDVCDEIALNLIDTLEEMSFLNEKANLSCLGYTSHSFGNAPGICTNSSCCGGDCAGQCVFGHTGTKRSCGSSAGDHDGLLRLCPCSPSNQVRETAVNSTTVTAHVPELPDFGEGSHEEAKPVAVLSQQIQLDNTSSRYSRYVSIRNGSWPYSADNTSDWTSDWSSNDLGLRVLSFNFTPDINASAPTSSWHMTWRYVLQAGRVVSSVCPSRFGSSCSFTPAHVFINGVLVETIRIWAVPESSVELDSWVASEDVVSSSDTCIECKNMTAAISLKNGANEVNIVLEESEDAEASYSLSVQQLSFLPTCQVAMQDTWRYRFCKPYDATPTWDKSKIRQTSLYLWQRERLEVLTFAAPVRLKHDRGTVVETVVMSPNTTDANPLDFGDPTFFDLVDFGIQNRSGAENDTGSRRLDSGGIVSRSPAQNSVDLEEKGSTEDLRIFSSYHAQRPGSAAETLGRMAAADEVPPDVVVAEVMDGSGEVRLVFTEWVVKAKQSSMMASLRVMPQDRLRTHDMRLMQVDLMKRGKVFVEGRRKSAIVQIRDQLLEAGCVAESFTGCQAVLDLPEGAFLDRNRNPSKPRSVLIDNLLFIDTAMLEEHFRRLAGDGQATGTLPGSGTGTDTGAGTGTGTGTGTGAGTGDGNTGAGTDSSIATTTTTFTITSTITTSTATSGSGSGTSTSSGTDSSGSGTGTGTNTGAGTSSGSTSGTDSGTDSSSGSGTGSNTGTGTGAESSGTNTGEGTGSSSSTSTGSSETESGKDSSDGSGTGTGSSDAADDTGSGTGASGSDSGTGSSSSDTGSNTSSPGSSGTGTSTATFVLDSSWAQYDADQDEQISVEELLLALGGSGGPGPDSDGGKGPGDPDPGGPGQGPPHMDEGGPGAGRGPPPSGGDDQGGSSGPGPSGPGPSGPEAGPDAGGGSGPDSGPDSGPEEGCVQCRARRLEILPAGTDAVELLLSRRLQGQAVELPRRLQGEKCCPSQPGGQPTDDVLKEMKQQQSKNQPLATGSQENFCHFTELFDVELGQCVKGRCRTPFTRPDENRFCQKIPESELNNIDQGKVVSDQLKLNGLPARFDVDSVLAGGSQRSEFEEAFIRDLAGQLDIPVAMLEVTGVAEGSVVVSFRILPGSQEEEVPAEGGGTSVETVTLVPSIVQMSLATVRQTLDSAASLDSILTYTDPAHGVAPPTAPQRAQQFSGQEALMQAFDGEALEKVPARTVETPEIYSLAPVGIGGRTKVNEYLPRSRASVTQDEKWDAPDKVDIDFAVFITPMHKKVDKDILCPSRAMAEDPVTTMWARDGNEHGYGGNFLFNTPEMMSFKQWRIPPDRRMKVLECETFDWLEEVMKEKAIRSGKNFSETQNPYTAEKMKDLDATCGMPDDAWINTSCQDLQSLRADHKDQYRVSCNQELFASSTMRKTLSIPLNGKWVFAESRRPGSLYKPEWMLDTLTSYYFTWDSTAEETEKLFSKNAPAGGDVQLMEDDALCTARGLKTPCPIEVLYTGKILYKGQHSGDNKKVLEKTGVSLAHLPASSPTVQPLLEIHMDVERTVELIRRGRPRWWPLDEDMTREILQCNARSYWRLHREACRKHGVVQQPAFPFAVDLEEAMADVTAARDKSITLQPGYVYTIDVVVGVIPLYVKDMWGMVRMSTFYVEVESARVYSQVLSFKERNQAQVRLKFRLSDKAKALLKQPVLGWIDLASQSGAWFGIWGLASVILSSCYSSLRMWGDLGPKDGEITLDEYQAKHEKKLELLKRKAARRIKAQLEQAYQQYGINVSLQKVSELLIEPSESKNLRKKVLLKEVLKDSNPLAELPAHVANLLGEVRVHLDDMVRLDSMAADGEDDELQQLEEEEKKTQIRCGSCLSYA